MFFFFFFFFFFVVVFCFVLFFVFFPRSGPYFSVWKAVLYYVFVR